MTHLHSAVHPTPLPPTDLATAHFFHLLYGQMSGWIELSAIEGDPDDREHCRFIQSWFAYNPHQLGDLLSRVDELAQHYGNVYVSVNVYERPRRSATIKPGRRLRLTCSNDGNSYSWIGMLDNDRPLIDVIRGLLRAAKPA